MKLLGYYCILKWIFFLVLIIMLLIINSFFELYYFKIYFDKLLCYIYVYNIYIFCFIYIYIMYIIFCYVNSFEYNNYNFFSIFEIIK